MQIPLASNIADLRPSATLAINERSAALEAQGRRIWRLGLGQSPFPVPAPVVEALRTHAHQKDYLPVQGLPALRAVIADWQMRHGGNPTTADDVLVAPGSKELLFLAQMALDCDLLIPAPSWVSYAPQAGIAGRRVEWVETRFEDDWMLTAEALEAVCERAPDRPRLLILNTPSNPTGRGLSAERLAAIAAVARRYGMIVISDEIYSMVHHGAGHHSIAQAYPEGTIVSSGLSKWCGAGGWRLGYFIFPAELAPLRRAMTAIASETYTAVSAPIQFASIRAFEKCAVIDAYVARSRGILDGLGRRLTRMLRAAGVRLPDPTGGFYLFADFEVARHRVSTSEALCEALLEQTGVACLPGACFGRPSTELTARLAYVNFDGTAALAAPGIIDDAWLDRHCDPTVTAIARIVDWVHKSK
jgi:aspartate aminotransferase